MEVSQVCCLLHRILNYFNLIAFMSALNGMTPGYLRNRNNIRANNSPFFSKDTNIFAVLDIFILTLIQLCGVRADPAVTEIVTLLERKVIDKSPLA